MKKIISLVRACMTDNMSLFKIKRKTQNKSSNRILLIFIVVMFFFSIWSYAEMIIEPLIEIKMEYVLLTLFVFITTILTLIEGIYKSSNLLFNCKDDDLLLSLPIKKSTVLFIRVLKFYIFELLYNSLFLVPAMVVYATKVTVGWEYYLSSIIALLILPIIPIFISCIIGGFISHVSSKSKYRNCVQIVITMIFIIFIFYISFNLQGMISSLAENATNINDVITKVYYPAGVYVKLVTNFNVVDLLIFVSMNILIFVLAIILFSNIYFKINSKVKGIKKGKSTGNYTIKARKPMTALIKKELTKFLNTPVFVINSALGLVLFVIACIVIVIKVDSFPTVLAEYEVSVTLEQIKAYAPVLNFILICFASLMSSITSSMISLEGKSFNILKSLPVSPYRIILSKVLTAVIIMLPFILIGDIILFIKFGLNLFQILLILLASSVLPLVSEIFGIIINIKNPKMDAENDTEVVKQSVSTMIAVLVGILSIGITIGGVGICLMMNISPNIVLLMGLMIYTIILDILLIYLNKRSVKEFNRINA